MSKGIPRYAAKRDANEPGIREDLADAGWLTQPLSIKDWPDLMAFKAGRKELIEIKAVDGKLERGQKAVHELLALFGIRVIVARTAEDFLRAVGDMR